MFDEPRPELVWTSVRDGIYQGGQIWRKVFATDPEQIPRVRHLVRTLLNTQAETAEYIVSELATNAVLHARGTHFLLEIATLPRGIRLAIYDQGGDGSPSFIPTAAIALGQHGYGLQAVAQLSARCGLSGNPETGHVVWAELDAL
ncbi:ATP-binding protein [Nonomuraea sp. NPDC050663]|uniref:ATP-binding protein n=1 Tax=Nonomuraea sp. NPDC050663 TaxID=3364370 RepID=UPI00379547EF